MSTILSGYQAQEGETQQLSELWEGIDAE